MTLQEIRLKQMEILDQIHKLEKDNSHKNTAKKCLCDICNQIRALGKEYENLTIARRKTKDPHQQKVNNILAKGQSATRSEIKFLLETVKMTKTDVAKMLGMHVNTFYKICSEWEIGMKRNRRAG